MKRIGARAVVIGAVTASLLLAGGAGAAFADPVDPDAAAADSGTAGKSYVALGDSYSAGFGLTPYSELPASGCFQADQNYPHLVAESLGLSLDDRTCSGAVTANIRDTEQVTITGAGTAPVQSDSLSADTDVVTVTIGGNDLGFSTVAQTCIAESATGPLVLDVLGANLANCKEFYAPVVDGIEIDRLKYLLDTTVAPALDETFALIAQKAPNAKVFVIGYPAITPDVANFPEAGCYSSPLGTGSNPFEPPFPENAFPFTETDTFYLHGTEARLDAAIGTAAAAHGATYISTLPLTQGNTACAPAGEAFINGITLNTTGGTPTPDPGLFVTLGALHPNTAGVAFLAEQVSQAVSAAFADDGDPEPTATPSPTPEPTGTATPVPAPGDGSGAGTGSGRPGLAATGSEAAPLGLVAVGIVAAGGLLLAVVTVARRRTSRSGR
ncbi:GDSL-type esterase/lipase family protein [Herbiconiux sp. A18JL235]|uniref:GDSL-type esterase/lipase family protein n=1 Tax=Herbiconiux sp. A18JL235 TaxID=3152363 RepID=A0AB39BBK3_9MICO